jgi:hypothetical protein
MSRRYGTCATTIYIAQALKRTIVNSSETAIDPSTPNRLEKKKNTMRDLSLGARGAAHEARPCEQKAQAACRDGPCRYLSSGSFSRPALNFFD